MHKIILTLAMNLIFGFFFTVNHAAFSQNNIINVNLTAKQALKKKYVSCKVSSNEKYENKTSHERAKRKVLTFEKLESIENPYTTLFKIGLSNKIVNNKTPRDSFLILYPYSQKINDTSYYLYPLPKGDSSTLLLPNMGSHPWIEPEVINFDASGKIKNIKSGGGAGSECCAGGDKWSTTIWFKDDICYSSTQHTQEPNEEIETQWDPTHSFAVTVIKNKGINVGYSKTTYSYLFKRGILKKMTELIEDKTGTKIKTIIYKFHYKKQSI